MTEALVGIHKERPIDLILFSGDLIDKAGKSFGESKMQAAFQSFQDIVIIPITEALGLPPYRFIFTLGNHEVDRDVVVLDEEEKLTGQLNTHGDVDWYMHKSELSIPRIAEYNILEMHFGRILQMS